MAVAAVGLLGITALATDAGLWLVSRRNAQNTADVASYGGVRVLAARGAAEAINAAQDSVLRNGFALADIQAINVGLWNGTTFTAMALGSANIAAANAVRVEISQPQRLGLARLLQTVIPSAWGGATSANEEGGPACTLSVNPPGGETNQVDGRTIVGGSVTIEAPDCVMAANDTSGKSVQYNGNSGPNIAGFRSAGSCFNCDGAGVPYQEGTATPDPFKYLQSLTMGSLTCTRPRYWNGAPLADGSNEVLGRNIGSARDPRWAPPNANNYTHITMQGSTSGTARAICAEVGDISLSSGQTLTLGTGTHYFDGTSLSANAGATIECAGCGRDVGTQTVTGVTLVFTNTSGDPAGTISINGGATVQLNAPGVGQGVPTPAYDGILIYRTPVGGAENGSPAMQINGNADSWLFGGIYAPTSEIEVSGNSISNAPDGWAGLDGGCTSIVGGRITFSGNATVNINACDVTGTAVAKPLVSRLVQ
ncbi:TadG family pilus assembly protein [Roseomonas sp. HF4]|uniref:TadG family pilus assembly protein n=1 Tax=Roseomonas sp. HF4 TaxID=2562313 RepID=UPI0014852FFF|nr:TadG family pilus assembly protein [Roseomonas sp. HF4]